MASPLANVSKIVANATRGKLFKGTLRRVVPGGLDNFGDAEAGTVATFTFEGIRDTFNAAFAAMAGIPVSDVRILIIAGSCPVTPKKDDQISLNGEWFQLRQLTEIDPANAAYTFAGFKISPPV